MPSNHLILCDPLLFLPSIFPSIRVFSNESVLHIRWPKYWSFSFNISPSNEHSGLISFRKPSTLLMNKPTSKENRDSPPSHAAVNQQNPQPQRSVQLWLNLAQLLEHKFPLETEYWGFPASLMVKVPLFFCRGRGFNSLVRELIRSCMLCCVSKKKKKKKKSEYYPSPVTLSFPKKKKKTFNEP